MISLARRNGRPLCIGHRGAAALAPENTLASFRAALEAGVDLIEFDVTARADGTLVVAHSTEEMSPDAPSLEEALSFFVEEAPELGVHVDLKVTGRERDIVDFLSRHGLGGRSLVSSYYVTTARAIAALEGDIRTGFTIPRRMVRISEEGRSAPIAHAGLRVLRCVTPTLVRPLLALTQASAVVLHHSVITPACVRAAHGRGAPVVAWTVDDPHELVRVDRAGVDAVVTNDPRIFAPRSVSTIQA